jgi:hypothetical protein
MAYAVVRTDNMFGTDVRAGLVSIKYMGANGTTPTAIQNGNVLKVGALMSGEREIFVGAAPAANDDLKDIVLVATPEVMYDERKRNLDEFINEAGRACRGYRLHKGDIFSVTKDALDGVAAPAVGNVVELKAGTKLNVAASATSGSTQVGKIIAVDVVGRYTYYVILVG